MPTPNWRDDFYKRIPCLKNKVIPEDLKNRSQSDSVETLLHDIGGEVEDFISSLIEEIEARIRFNGYNNSFVPTDYSKYNMGIRKGLDQALSILKEYK